MDRRFEVRKQEMLAECQVCPEVFEGIESRMVSFIEPFVESLGQPARQVHTREYMTGLVSDLKRKNIESIAYLHDKDRRNLQHFIGHAPWDHKIIINTLVDQVAQKIGEEDAVIVFDPSGFPKKGEASVGVQRQWCGRVGKTENCQVATCMGYVSRVNHTLIDTRLYLPESWTKDRARCQKAGVPKDVRFQTRHEHALEMLDKHGKKLPHAWVAGDDEMGKSAWFRRDLNDLGEKYLLSVPCNTTIRDLQTDEEVLLGSTAARKRPFQQVQDWKNELSQSAWQRVEVRDAEKGPLIVEVVACRVQTKISRCHMKYEEQLVIVRTREANGKYKYDYYFSNAEPSTKSEEYGRVACAAHRIEECIKRGKSEAGLADYEVRNWLGWHHHQALSILAVWFLVTETERGKKMDTCNNASANSGRHRNVALHKVGLQNGQSNFKEQNPSFSPQRNSKILSLQKP